MAINAKVASDRKRRLAVSCTRMTHGTTAFVLAPSRRDVY
jgi:hypothetical protein